MKAIFNRFRQFRLVEIGQGNELNRTELSQDMDILDFLLCINLLSNIPPEKKLKSKWRPNHLLG